MTMTGTNSRHSSVNGKLLCIKIPAMYICDKFVFVNDSTKRSLTVAQGQDVWRRNNCAHATEIDAVFANAIEWMKTVSAETGTCTYYFKSKPKEVCRNPYKPSVISFITFIKW